MRLGLVIAVCGMAALAGCSKSTSAPSGGTTTAPILPPVANAGGPYTGTSGSPIAFSGAASTDPQGQALTYSWSFGDGTTATGITTTHTYSGIVTGGSTTFTVGLQVQNASGFTGQATTSATIKGPTGLAGAALTGVVATGKKPIVGAHVYLFAANTTGAGGPGTTASGNNASISLESAAQTGAADAVGAYVLSSGTGAFSLTGDYTCTPGQQLYLYALGGNAGSGANPAAGLLAAIGSCPAAGGAAIVAQLNEVSTVAAAYALAGYATDATHISATGTSTLETTGLANAFANAANLETLATGVALSSTPAGNGTVPQTLIDSLANILSACVDLSNPSGSCSTLFSNSFSLGVTGIAPADTATAAIYIAHNPAPNASSIYQVTPNTPPYTPALSSSVSDFTIAISYSGGGLSGPQGLAIDAGGNAWVTNFTGNSVTRLTALGAVATGSPYTAAGVNNPTAVAIDATGNIWISNYGSNSVTELSPTGALLSGGGYATGSKPRGIALDGSGNVWVANSAGNSVTKLTSAGAAVAGSPYTAGGLNGPFGIAIDGAGDAWVTNFGGASVTELSSAGAAINGSPFTGTNLLAPEGIAIDSAGSAWVANSASSTVARIAHTGQLLSAPSGYSGGGLATPYAIAIDGSGSAWVDSQNPFAVSGIDGTGAQVSGSGGYANPTLNLPSGLAVDGSGDTWVVNNGNNTVTEFIGLATPVVTPIVAGLPAAPAAAGTSSLGTRP